MSDDWNIGDLAVCVEDGPITCSCGLRHTGWRGKAKLGDAGKIALLTSSMSLGSHGCLCLTLRFANGTGGLVERFRKVLPDAGEACETEFVTLLKRSKQRISA